MIPRDTTAAMITVSMKIAMLHTLLLTAEHIKPTALLSNSELRHDLKIQNDALPE